MIEILFILHNFIYTIITPRMNGRRALPIERVYDIVTKGILFLNIVSWLFTI